jgi:3-hydroxypropanoate dehydrogenase
MLDQAARDAIFFQARTHHAFLDRPVSDAQLRDIYGMTKMAPTSGNTQPLRIVFVRSKEAKEKLVSTLSETNVAQTREAPVTAILAQDLHFYERMHKLLPEHPAIAERFRADATGAVREPVCLRNSSIQSGYFMIAVRAAGLDYGAMTGYNAEKLDALFFPDGRWKSNYLCNIGYGDRSRLTERHVRLEFDEACSIL